jgi:hypothetical protein
MSQAPDPLVLPVAPRRGWATASSRRRALAVAFVAGPVAVLASTAVPRHADAVPVALGLVVDLVVLLAAPFCCHAAARVLRPDVQGARPTERTARHAAAAVATPYGVAALCTLATMAGGPSRFWLFAATGRPVLLLEILVASFVGVVTLAWGLVALLWRASRRWPGRVPWPGPLTVEPD